MSEILKNSTPPNGRSAKVVHNDYSPAPTLNFGQALAALKQGRRVARAGWNGRGMFAYRVPANTYPAQTGAAKAHFGENGMVPYNAYLALKGIDNTVSTWAPSGSDVLAEDWIVLAEEGKLPPHQQRVLDEQHDLEVKIAALDKFASGAIYAGLPIDEQIRLSAQADAMKVYSNVLLRRIAAFQ